MLKTCRLRPTESGFSRPRAGEGAGVFPFLTVLFRKLFPVSEASLWVWVSTLKGQGLALLPGQAPPLKPSPSPLRPWGAPSASLGRTGSV